MAKLRRTLAVATVAVVPALVVSAQQQVATRRIPQLENEQVRVWKSIIAPHQPLSMHRHDHGRVIVALEGGALKVVPEEGEPKVVEWETGKAYWLPADPPEALHGDVNEGDHAIEVMVIEVQR